MTLVEIEMKILMQKGVKIPSKWEYFIFGQNFCKSTRYFLEKFTQLEKFKRPPVAKVVTNFKSVVHRLNPHVFQSFLTKTWQDQVLPSHVHGKIQPHSTQFWLWFYSITTFFWDTLHNISLISHLSHHKDQVYKQCTTYDI